MDWIAGSIFFVGNIIGAVEGMSFLIRGRARISGMEGLGLRRGRRKRSSVRTDNPSLESGLKRAMEGNRDASIFLPIGWRNVFRRESTLSGIREGETGPSLSILLSAAKLIKVDGDDGEDAAVVYGTASSFSFVAIAGDGVVRGV